MTLLMEIENLLLSVQVIIKQLPESNHSISRKYLSFSLNIWNNRSQKYFLSICITSLEINDIITH